MKKKKVKKIAIPKHIITKNNRQQGNLDLYVIGIEELYFGWVSSLSLVVLIFWGLSLSSLKFCFSSLIEGLLRASSLSFFYMKQEQENQTFINLIIIF